MSHERPDLPPERPLPDASRAAIRGRLLAATGGQPGSGRRWPLPLAAAASVIVIATATGYAALQPGGDPDSGSPADGGSAVPTPMATDSGETLVPTIPSLPPPTLTPTPPDLPILPTPTPGGGMGGGKTCFDVTRGDVVASWPSAKGTSFIVTTGGTSQLCDDSGGKATLHAPQPLDPPPAVPMTLEDLDFSTKVIYADRRQLVTAHVAGGQLPQGVTGITYRFPDAHEEVADVQRAGGRSWWRMEYTSYDGMLADPDVDLTELDPVQVTVALSGTYRTYELGWMDFACAQINHGC